MSIRVSVCVRSLAILITTPTHALTSTKVERKESLYVSSTAAQWPVDKLKELDGWPPSSLSPKGTSLGCKFSLSTLRAQKAASGAVPCSLSSG